MLISLILNSLPATPHSPYPCIPHHSYAHTPDTAHSLVAAPAKASAQQLPKHLSSTCRSICAAPVEASAQPMLDGDSLPVRYGIHGQREGIVLYQHLEELLRGVFAIGAFEKME